MSMGKHAGLNGRPRGARNYASLISEYGEKTKNKDKDIIIDGRLATRQEFLVEKIWEYALEGEFKFIEMIINRIDGKPRETIDIKKGQPGIMRILFGDEKEPDDNVEFNGIDKS